MHHLIVRLDAGPIQFIYRWHSPLAAAEIFLHKILFPPFSRTFYTAIARFDLIEFDCSFFPPSSLSLPFANFFLNLFGNTVKTAPCLSHVVVVGPFAEKEEGIGIANDVVKAEGEDPEPQVI